MTSFFVCVKCVWSASELICFLESSLIGGAVKYYTSVSYS